MADELGALEKEHAILVAPFESKLPRIKALKALLQAACPAGTPSSAEWIVEGARFGVRLGPQANERSIDFKGLVKKIGAAAFARFASCTLTALEAHVPPEMAEAVVSSDQTGPRKLSTFEKGVTA
jgi:hypothetical protein